MARVKGFTTFEASTNFRRFLASLSFVNSAFSLVTLLFGELIRFSDPNGSPAAKLAFSLSKHRSDGWCMDLQRTYMYGTSRGSEIYSV
jgi:hypothetical protein